MLRLFGHVDHFGIIRMIVSTIDLDSPFHVTRNASPDIKRELVLCALIQLKSIIIKLHTIVDGSGIRDIHLKLACRVSCHVVTAAIRIDIKMVRPIRKISIDDQIALCLFLRCLHGFGFLRRLLRHGHLRHRLRLGHRCNLLLSNGSSHHRHCQQSYNSTTDQTFFMHHFHSFSKTFLLIIISFSQR